MKEKFDLITTDFTYVLWLGDRKGIEQQTKTWDKIIVDRKSDLKNWVELLRRLVLDAGHAPATVKLFMDLCDRKK